MSPSLEVATEHPEEDDDEQNGANPFVSDELELRTNHPQYE